MYFKIRGIMRYRPLLVALSLFKTALSVVAVGADQTGLVGDPPCIKISYCSRLAPGAEKGHQAMFKIGYVSAMYSDMG